jgi:adenylate cyclase
MTKQFKNNLSFYGFNLFVAFIVFVISLIPFIRQLNQLFIDQLHGRMPARSEIVVVSIDDKSLQEIGAWPWDRSNFAKVVQKLDEAGAKVVGIDVLFLEPRTGDEELQKILTEAKTPVVLASKLQSFSDQDTLKPIYDLPADHTGFINFDPDGDAKIRRTYFPSQDTNQLKSFAFQIVEHYYPDEFFSQQLKEVSKKKSSNNTLLFNYTSDEFQQVSLVDVLNGRVEKEALKDKIILIGTITQDLKSELSDNLTDIFGNSTPGILIHANIVNSLLENRFQAPVPVWVTLLISLILSVFLTWIFRKLNSNVVDVIICLVAFFLMALVGVIVFEFGIDWPFFTFTLIIIFMYVSTLAQKYLTENKQRRFIQMAFAQYINPSLMKKLIDNPSQLKLGGEKKEMTVMFSDVRGFTSLSEKMTPEELISLLNDYLDEMCDVILKQKGTIDKFIGDAIMALWNAPLDDNKHQYNALKTSVLMIDTLNAFNEKHPDSQLNIGVGLNTGEMIVGNVGSRQRFDYTVLGDNVNLASRVEGLTKKYGLQVLATEETIKGIDDPELIFRLVDRVIVKGKSKPIRLYQPLRKTEKNEKLKELYETGFKAYEKGDFKTAKKQWLSLKNDPTSQLMIERLSELEQTTDWKGIWEWHEK